MNDSELNVAVERADYQCRAHRVSIQRLLAQYAADPAIDGKGLHASLLDRVVDELAARPNALTLLAFDRSRVHNPAIGLVNAFENFSTFAVKPLLNLHDVMVDHAYRGRGIGHRLIQAAIDEAERRGCCRLTLEVYRGNKAAMALYRGHGFDPPETTRDLGETLYLSREV